MTTLVERPKTTDLREEPRTPKPVVPLPTYRRIRRPIWLRVRRAPWAVAHGADNMGRCVERFVFTTVDPAP